MSNLENLGDVDLTTNVPANKDVLAYDSTLSKWVPKSLEKSDNPSCASSYVIELDRWGIKNDGTEPLKTTVGINNAFLWAKENNYREVILPEGSYLIDKNSSIKFLSNTHYKLYGCLFIKESNNLTGYEILTCNGIKNTVIEGATVKGERETHDYSINSTHEWGYGILIKNLCYNISIINCESFECTGDGLAISADFSALGGAQHNKTNGGHFSKGDIDANGNVDNTKISYVAVNKFFDITTPLAKEVGYIFYSGDGYGGYGPGLNLNKVPIKVHFYDSNQIYLGNRSYRTYEYIYTDAMPLGTKFVRFSFLGNFDAMDGNLHYISCAKTPQYITFRGCNTHKNRRLGASVMGGRFITYENCEIHNNSNKLIVSKGCNPGYGIDVEDGYMNNQRILVRSCNFHDNRAGDFICVSTRGVTLENNKFEKLVYFNGQGDDYLSQGNLYHGPIRGKSITNGIEKDGTFCTFKNDSVFGTQVGLDGGNTTLENCVFTKTALQLSGETVKVINCKLTYEQEGTTISALTLSGKNVEIHGSLFDIRGGNAYGGFLAPNDYLLISNSQFFTGETAGGILGSFKEVIIKDSEFIHTGAKVNYTRVYATEQMRIERNTFKDHSFRIVGGDYFNNILAVDKGYITHYFKNNKIIWTRSSTTYVHELSGPGIGIGLIPRVEVSNNRLEIIDQNVSLGSLYNMRIFVENHLTFLNNTIVTIKTSGSNTNGTITLDYAYRSGTSVSRPKTTIISQNNTGINSDILFTANLNNQLEKLSGNTPLASFASSQPTSGTYQLGELIYNSTPVAGGYLGWVCITAGRATNRPWAPSTDYVKGTIIYYQGHVYQAQNNGTSNTDAPNFPKVSGGIILDNNIGWKEIGLLATFKQFGPIQQ